MERRKERRKVRSLCVFVLHRRRSRIDGFVKNSRSLSKVALVYFSIGAIERMFSPITEVSSAVRFRRYGNGLQSDRNSDTFRIAPFVRHLRISLKPPIQHCLPTALPQPIIISLCQSVLLTNPLIRNAIEGNVGGRHKTGLRYSNGFSVGMLFFMNALLWILDWFIRVGVL
jgi:hypothetical protein